MSNTNTNCITHPNLLTGIAVVGGVVVKSIGLIDVLSYVTEKINNLSTQLTDLRCNYRNIMDYINDVERCSYCNKMYRRKDNLVKHEYMCGLLDRLYS